MTIKVGSTGPIGANFSQSVPSSNTDLAFTVTRNGVTNTYTAGAATQTVTLVGTTTKVAIGFLTAADGTQNAFAKISNSQLIANAVLRSDGIGEGVDGHMHVCVVKGRGGGGQCLALTDPAPPPALAAPHSVAAAL